jgi:hypothetical protein
MVQSGVGRLRSSHVVEQAKPVRKAYAVYAAVCLVAGEEAVRYPVLTAGDQRR